MHASLRVQTSFGGTKGASSVRFGGTKGASSARPAKEHVTPLGGPAANPNISFSPLAKQLTFSDYEKKNNLACSAEFGVGADAAMKIYKQELEAFRLTALSPKGKKRKKSKERKRKHSSSKKSKKKKKKHKKTESRKKDRRRAARRRRESSSDSSSSDSDSDATPMRSRVLARNILSGLSSSSSSSVYHPRHLVTAAPAATTTTPTTTSTTTPTTTPARPPTASASPTNAHDIMANPSPQHAVRCLRVSPTGAHMVSVGSEIRVLSYQQFTALGLSC